MIKLRLKRKWRILLGILGAILIFLVVTYVITNYLEQLEKCDIEKGYTCNIFGK